jgi:hypothetical protein
MSEIAEHWHASSVPHSQAAGVERSWADVLHPAGRWWVGLGIIGVGTASLIFFYTRGLTNLYGDAIAHMEGARRLWDSRTPGYGEIGSVWLPLFHLLASPLTLNDFLWRSGLAGSLVSTAAFMVAAWFMFRLGTEINGSLGGGIAALAGFLLCPSMLYLASTPLTEPLALLWLVLLVYALFRYQQEHRLRFLIMAAVSAFLGTLTRYDGWNLLPFAALFVLWTSDGSWRVRVRRAGLFLLIAGAGPLLWVVHNTYRFGNPLEFYNGPFSARAIYAHQIAITGFRYPTDGSLLLSARYYLEDLKLIIGAWPLELAALGMMVWALDASARRRRAVVILFLVSLPFYLQAMAHAAVPLYVPSLFPHTYYNLRYGIELLPAVAILPSFLLSSRLSRRVRAAALVAMLGVVLGQAVSMLRGGAQEIPIVKESVLNTPCQSKRQEAVSRFLRAHYDGQAILLAAGKWPCVMPEVGVSYRQTITENNRKYWGQLVREPQVWVQWIIRSEGDPVDGLMRAHPESFLNYVVVERGQFAGEEGFSVYRRK